MPRRKKNADDFPYGDKYTELIKEAEGVARARYHRDLRSTAEEIVKEVQEESGIDVQQRIAEEADSAVIYTKRALDIIVESENWQAIDDMGEMPDTANGAVTLMAYMAYEQDLREAVDEVADEWEVEVNPSSSKPKKGPKRGRGGARRR